MHWVPRRCCCLWSCGSRGCWFILALLPALSPATQIHIDGSMLVGSGGSPEWICIVDMNTDMSKIPMPQTQGKAKPSSSGELRGTAEPFYRCIYRCLASVCRKTKNKRLAHSFLLPDDWARCFSPRDYRVSRLRSGAAIREHSPPGLPSYSVFVSFIPKVPQSCSQDQSHDMAHARSVISGVTSPWWTSKP